MKRVITVNAIKKNGKLCSMANNIEEFSTLLYFAMHLGGMSSNLIWQNLKQAKFPDYDGAWLNYRDASFQICDEGNKGLIKNEEFADYMPPLTEIFIVPAIHPMLELKDRLEILRYLKSRNATFDDLSLDAIGEFRVPLQLIRFLVEEVGLNYERPLRPEVPFSILTDIAAHGYAVALGYFLNRGCDPNGCVKGLDCQISAVFPLQVIFAKWQQQGVDWISVDLLLRHGATLRYDPYVWLRPPMVSLLENLALAANGQVGGSEYDRIVKYLLDNSDFVPSCANELSRVREYCRAPHPKLVESAIDESNQAFASIKYCYAVNLNKATGCGYCNIIRYGGMFRCGGCKKILYCSRKCQAEGWKTSANNYPAHKTICSSQELQQSLCVADMIQPVANQRLAAYYFFTLHLGTHFPAKRAQYQKFRHTLYHDAELLKKATMEVCMNLKTDAAMKNYSQFTHHAARMHHAVTLSQHLRAMREDAVLKQSVFTVKNDHHIVEFLFTELGIPKSDGEALRKSKGDSNQIWEHGDILKLLQTTHPTSPEYVCPCLRRDVQFVCVGCGVMGAKGVCSECQHAFCSRKCFVENWTSHELEAHVSLCEFDDILGMVNQMGYFYCTDWDLLYLLN